MSVIDLPGEKRNLMMNKKAKQTIPKDNDNNEKYNSRHGFNNASMSSEISSMATLQRPSSGSGTDGAHFAVNESFSSLDALKDGSSGNDIEGQKDNEGIDFCTSVDFNAKHLFNKLDSLASLVDQLKCCYGQKCEASTLQMKEKHTRDPLETLSQQKEERSRLLENLTDIRCYALQTHAEIMAKLKASEEFLKNLLGATDQEKSTQSTKQQEKSEEDKSNFWQSFYCKRKIRKFEKKTKENYRNLLAMVREEQKNYEEWHEILQRLLGEAEMQLGSNVMSVEDQIDLAKGKHEQVRERTHNEEVKIFDIIKTRIGGIRENQTEWCNEVKKVHINMMDDVGSLKLECERISAEKAALLRIKSNFDKKDKALKEELTEKEKWASEQKRFAATKEALKTTVKQQDNDLETQKSCINHPHEIVASNSKELGDAKRIMEFEKDMAEEIKHCHAELKKQMEHVAQDFKEIANKKEKLERDQQHSFEGKHAMKGRMLNYKKERDQVRNKEEQLKRRMQLLEMQMQALQVKIDEHQKKDMTDH